jgi:hypothetical protein
MRGKQLRELLPILIPERFGVIASHPVAQLYRLACRFDAKALKNQDSFFRVARVEQNPDPKKTALL